MERNVADLADPPRHAPQPVIRAWTPEQLRRFLDHVSAERLYAAWHLAAWTGMRRGEVLGLRWVDVDLRAGRVAVRQTLVLVNGEPTFSEPKTRRSRRTIDLDVYSHVLPGMQQSAAERIAGLVFDAEDAVPAGTPIDEEW